MPKPNKENEIEEVKQYFKKRIDSMKERKIAANTRQKSISDYDKRSYMNAKWSWTFALDVYSALAEIWEFLENITLAIYDTEVETTNFKKRLEKLDREFKKYRPTLKSFRQVLERTQKIIRNGT